MAVARILALTDLSENSCTGLALAESLARRFHGRVVVGYAHTRTDILRAAGGGKEEVRRLAEWVRKDDEEHLRHLVGRYIDPLRLSGVETVEAPGAREGVTELVERCRPDLVCMATRGRTGLAHLLLGSVAEHAIRTCRVPVVVTKTARFASQGQPLRVMACLDLVTDPLGLVRRLSGLLTPRDELVLAHVVESFYYSPSPYGAELALPQPDVPALLEAARRALLAVDPGPGAPRLRVEVWPGRPGEALLELEGKLEPHLVAVRTHGRRGFDRLMLGSVSEFLARRCRAPLLVFPKP